MGLVRTAIGVALPVLLLPTAAFAAPNWATPVAPLSANVTSTTAPQVASNARGDTAVAWLDFATGHVFVSERPAGGTFTTGAEVSPIADQVLGSVELDAAGNIYVFFVTQQSTNNASRPRVGVKPIGGSSWVVTPLAPAAATLPPQAPMAGAVAPDGRAVAVWLRADINNAVNSRLDFSTKPAGSSTWAPKAEIPGFIANSPGPLQLETNSAGQAVLAYSRQACANFSQGAHGTTMSAAGVWATAGALNTCASNDAGLAGGPVAGIDESGRAWAAWSRNNAPPAGSGNDIVQFTTTTVGTPFPTAAASGLNDLSAAGANAGSPAIAVAPDGTTTVAWIRGGVVQERTRAPGGGAFGSVTTIPNTLTGPSGTLLAKAGDGSMVALWTGTSSATPVLGAARRTPGAASFTALPQVPGTDNANPSLAVADDQGNFPATWLHTDTSGPTYVVQATAFDVAGPAISNVTFPATGSVGTPFSYGATLLDRWSPSSGQWAFGDGTTGALNGTKAYAAVGSYTATLTATDALGNSTSTTSPITVGVGVGPGGPGGGDIVAPLLTARLTNTTFAVNPNGRAETPVAALAKKGTTFVYSITEAARVVFTIHQKLPGRRVGGRCVKPTRRNAARRKCTRFVKRGAFAQQGTIGTQP